MLAWHNSPALKAEVSARMLQHRIEDSIIQGLYQDINPKLASGYRGCLIGCTLPQMADPEVYNLWHQRVEELYGIERVLAHVFDKVFESLHRRHAAWFAVSTIEAIPVGADLSNVGALLSDDIAVEAMRGHKEYARQPRDHRRWLAYEVSNFLDEYSNRVAPKKALWIAERLLTLLSEAPVPNQIVTPEPVNNEVIPASVEVATYEETTRVHESA